MRTFRRAPVLLLLLAALLLALAVIAPVAPAGAHAHKAFGVRAYAFIDRLTRITNPDGTYTPIPRAAGTAGELAAAEKVQGWFADAGYVAGLQAFSYVRGKVTYNSQNVVAYRPADHRRRCKPRPLVIVGAHYDAVTAGQGADDNASGVGVMLEVAQRLARHKIDYDVVFIAFGAEEAGLRGSSYYVGQMTQVDKDRAIAMINFDSLIFGDKLYIHAGFNEKTWARDAMLRLIRRYKLPIETQPGLNPEYPAGLTPNGFSDYTAFNIAGIPIVAFESTNWEIGDLDGYEQTVEYGSYWHTSNDTLEAIEAVYPERPMERLRAYTKLVFEFLKHHHR